MNPSFFFRVGGGARRESGSERRRVVAGGGWRSDAPGPRPCLDTPAGEGQNKEIHTAAPLQRRAGSKAVGGRGGRGVLPPAALARGAVRRCFFLSLRKFKKHVSEFEAGLSSRKPARQRDILFRRNSRRHCRKFEAEFAKWRGRLNAGSWISCRKRIEFDARPGLSRTG